MLSVKGCYTEYPNERGRDRQGRAGRDASTCREGKLFTLLGPSGCGKTTTLRSIAGLERPRAGEIAVDGHVVYSSAQRRVRAAEPARLRHGVPVLRDLAAHDRVRERGVPAAGRRKKRYAQAEIREQGDARARRRSQLDELADREATKLSGGQQQRLALARALVMEPALLLLDEPLSNLDAKLRERMRFELKRLQRELGITTVYVTHDQSEALALSHEIAVMNEGRIEQIGTPREIYERPREPVRRRLRRQHQLPRRRGARRRRRERLLRVRTEIGDLRRSRARRCGAGEKVRALGAARGRRAHRSAGRERRQRLRRAPSTRRCSSARSSISR